MKLIRVLLTYGFVLASSIVLAEAGVPETIEDAKKLRDEIVNKTNQLGRIPNVFRNDWSKPLFAFFKSPNPEIRAIAMEAIPLLSSVSADDFVLYFKTPLLLTERNRLLAYGMSRENESSREARALAFDYARIQLNEQLCPPEYDLLIQLVAHWNSHWSNDSGTLGKQVVELVDSKNVRPFISRTLSILSKLNSLDRRLFPGLQNDDYFRAQLLQVILTIDENIAGDLILEWYKNEPDAKARSVIVDARVKWPLNWRGRRDSLLNLAGSDWDASIAKKAKAILRKND